MKDTSYNQKLHFEIAIDEELDLSTAIYILCLSDCVYHSRNTEDINLSFIICKVEKWANLVLYQISRAEVLEISKNAMDYLYHVKCGGIDQSEIEELIELALEIKKFTLAKI